MFGNLPSANNPTLPKKILLAEDDSSIRRFIEIILQKENYQVTSTEDGLAAMKSALNAQYDAIIADAMMPNLSGFDLCRLLRQNPSYQNTPIIILSGFEDQSEGPFQADAYFLKGNNLKENLLEKLHALLNVSPLSVG